MVHHVLKERTNHLRRDVGRRENVDAPLGHVTNHVECSLLFLGAVQLVVADDALRDSLEEEREFSRDRDGRYEAQFLPIGQYPVGIPHVVRQVLVLLVILHQQRIQQAHRGQHTHALVKHGPCGARALPNNTPSRCRCQLVHASRIGVEEGDDADQEVHRLG